MIKKSIFGKGTVGVKIELSNAELFLLAQLAAELKNPENNKVAVTRATNFFERLTLDTGIEKAHNELFNPVSDTERLGGLKETKSRNEEDIFNED